MNLHDIIMANPETTILGSVIILLVGALIASVKFAVTQFIERKKIKTELEILRQDLENKKQEYTMNCDLMSREASEERRKEELHRIDVEIKKVELETMKYELNMKKRNSTRNRNQRS